MSPDEKRKWLPAEAYRFLVLFALAHADGPRTKRALAWEVRANHYMITKVLADLVRAGHVTLSQEGGEYRLALHDSGRAFLAEHRGYARSTFGPALDAHFRFGKRPAWADWSDLSP